MDICKKFFRNAITFFANPFSKNLPLFAASLPIQFIQLLALYLLDVHFGAGLLAGSIAWAYLLTLPQGFSNNKTWRGIYAGVILTLTGLLGLLQLVCAMQFEEMVYSTHLMLMANTNPNEAGEFLTTFIDLPLILTALAILALTIVLYQAARRISRHTPSSTPPHSIHLILTFLCLLLVAFTSYTKTWFDSGIGRPVWAFISLNDFKSYDLATTQQQFEVEEASDFHTSSIIVIMGESFDKLHSNLYGYNKNTTPRLSQRESDSTLVVFSSVKAPAPITNLSIRQMLSLSESHDDNNWQTRPMLPTALRKSGYNTMWLSNQTAVSVFDNALGQLAQLCDSNLNLTKAHMAMKSNYDEVVLKPFASYMKGIDNNGHNFCFVHLMGSHASYALRYPERFNHFKETDYPDQPENRRQNFATYDNSILYNDYIVDSLMSISDQADAIVIYLSDHGQDFYYTRDMATHGRIGNPESFEAGCRIPFMIYFTEKFRQNHPETIAKIRKFTDKEFNGCYLMNTVMELAGYDITGADLFKNSLFGGEIAGQQTE